MALLNKWGTLMNINGWIRRGTLMSDSNKYRWNNWSNDNDKLHKDLYINKVEDRVETRTGTRVQNRWWVNIMLDFRKIEQKQFTSELQALKFAKKYMRSH